MMYAKAAENLERTEQRHSEDMFELMKEEKEQLAQYVDNLKIFRKKCEQLQKNRIT